MKHIVVLVCFCTFVLVQFASAQNSALLRKKLIATGWDNADSARLAKNVRLMEKRPFGGVFLAIQGTREDGRSCALRHVQTAEAWKREWFAAQIAELKGIEFRSFSDNFITIGANPGNVDWFDDDGWTNVVEHWAIAAWIAREAGFKGLLFDPEPYRKPYAQFSHAAQEQAAKHSFEEYALKARERGRQVMAAVAKEFPDLTLFCYFMNSANRTAAKMADPEKALRGLHYGLFPAFINGWLDVAPPEVTFVDGCEQAYRFNSRLQYLSASVDIKGRCQSLVAPENRAKYRAQVQVSFGIYIDAYWNPEDSKWNYWRIECGDTPPVEKLMTNVQAALEGADEYVWIYGEKFRWWPTPNGRVFPQSWPEALPNCDLALLSAVEPEALAKHLWEKAVAVGKPPLNLIKNGSFETTDAKAVQNPASDWVSKGAPAGWTTWKGENETGTFSHDQKLGAAKIAGIRRHGCFIQKIDKVEEGEFYLVKARVKLSKRSSANIRIRWQTAEGKWTREEQDTFVFPQAPDADGWCEFFGTATVPEGAGQLVILLGASGQKTEADAAWFDDVLVLRTDQQGALFAHPPVRYDLQKKPR